MSEEALEKFLVAKIEALQNELTKSERELSKRLEGMNEFRAALKDAQQLMASRELVDSMHANTDNRLRALETRAAYGLGYVAGVAAAVAVVISVGITMIK